MAKIVRLHRDRAKPLVHVFTETGYALSIPAGFRDPRLHLGRELDEEDIPILRQAGRDYENVRTERRIARAVRNATAPALDTVVESIERDHRGRIYLRLADETSVRVAAGDEVLLPPGTALSAGRVAEMRTTSDRLRVGEMIDRLTNVRARSEREVRERLGRRGVEGPALDAAIERRQGYGILPDQEIARRFLERAARKGKSARAVSPALRRLVSDVEAIERAAEGLDPEAGLEGAAALAARGLDLSAEADRRRFVGRMGRRGWSYGQIRPYLLRSGGADPAEG